jgi:hypothetical protein
MPVIRRPLHEAPAVPAERSARAISAELVTIGATQISLRYRSGEVVGLTWSMPVRGTDVNFAMPARTAGVLKSLLERQKGPVSAERRQQLEERARRIAWRALLHWVEAQVVLAKSGIVEPAEPFCAYAMDHGKSLYECFAVETGRQPAGAKS